ncbi:allophanate hydrolase [Halarcobacter ebronensis]|uniref:Allophanate hydrolase n=1 Tax=Halarcobacter ebronensis TaxID=1462615 RepID=A0A4Q0YFC0_9BACT|nr:allophanate hydrolase [Halarcobacter ebronensis]RXJ69212.1 allophanate hydrolase [Halarcobacter ebronensis]
MLENQLFDISHIHEAYKKGVTVKEIIQEVYRRIEEVADDGIFIYLNSKEKVLKEVSSLEEIDLTKKPLWGIPFAVKDNIDVKNLPTTAACPEYEYIAKEDAFVVKLLKEAGAICIGKTNLDQFATGLVGVRTPYEVPKNAVDSSIVPGGSSSGSAVCVSHQIVSFSLGTDTAGSGRVPAALNNIVGFKPTLGTLSKQGVVPACLTLDTISIFALTIDDATKLFDITSKYNVKDPYSIKKEERYPKNSSNLTVAIPNKNSMIFYEDSFEEKSYKKTVELIKKRGFFIKEIDLEPFFEVGELLYEGSWVAERYTVIGNLIENSPQKVLEITRNIISKAKNFSSSDVYRDIYKLNKLKREIEIIMEDVDLLALPTIPRPYSVQDLKDEPIVANSRLGLYTKFVNLLNFSAIAFPVEKREDGFASGITAMSTAHKESILVEFSKELQEEMTLYYGNSNQKIVTKVKEEKTLKTNEIEFAVVGAHMQEMPLNNELLKLNSRFLYKSKTAKKYKFYKLQGDSPIRPGLVKVKDGVAIELEVWAMPMENFGAFEKTIPSPLCIGTIELENSKEVKGFLCESYAIETATNISQFGGFRTYLDSISK